MPRSQDNPRGRRREAPHAHPVDSGTAELVRDPDRRHAWTLHVDGTPQSHVDLDDPTWLGFEYVRRLGHVVDLVAPPGQPLDVVHLGGGGLTLARYVAATRPRSRQRVFEIDAALVELVRSELPLASSSGIRVGSADAREGLGRLREASADLVVCDVFKGARTPAHLTTRELVDDAARVLRRAGCYAVNVADGPPLAFARAQVATLASVFGHVVLVADPAVLRGRRFGNLVLAGSAEPLPADALARRVAADPAMGRLLDGGDLVRFAGSAPVVTDADAVASPAPPAQLFSRRVGR